MTAEQYHPPDARVVEVMEGRLAGRDTCAALVDGFEPVVGAIWVFTARLLGDAGSRAVLTRALQVAAREEPLLRQVRVGATGVDCTALREGSTSPPCEPNEVRRALERLAIAIFRTLAGLTGDVLVTPLLRRLTEEDPSSGAGSQK